MVFKSFRVRLIIRVLILVLSLLSINVVLFQDEWYVTTLGAVLVFFGLVVELIIFMEKTNRKFTSFLMAIKNQDFSGSYCNEITGESFEELNSAYKTITNEFNSVRSKEKIQFHYLKTLINHIDIALFSYSATIYCEFLCMWHYIC